MKFQLHRRLRQKIAGSRSPWATEWIQEHLRYLVETYKSTIFFQKKIITKRFMNFDSSQSIWGDSNITKSSTMIIKLLFFFFCYTNSFSIKARENCCKNLRKNLSVNHMLCWWCWRSGLGFHVHGFHHTFALTQALITQQGMEWWSIWYILKNWFSLSHKCIFIEAKMIKLLFKNLKVTTNMHAFAYT